MIFTQKTRDLPAICFWLADLPVLLVILQHCHHAMIFSLVLLLWLLAAALAEYDAGDAAGYLRLNAVAVCEDRRIAGWNCGRQCSTTAALVENGSQVLIGPTPVYNLHGFVARLRREGSSCVVAIAGTSFYNWRNIRADLEFWRTKWPTWSGSCADWCYGCEVMKGFASSYQELRDEIFASLEQLKCSAVTFTGHSLGGAIAVLASLEARACHNFTVSVWTYGMPRVGNLAFVEAYVSTAKQRQQSPPMWRITRDFDLIPQLPQTWLGYYHIPWAVRYWKHDTEKVICTERYEDPDCTYASGTMADITTILVSRARMKIKPRSTAYLSRLWSRSGISSSLGGLDSARRWCLQAFCAVAAAVAPAFCCARDASGWNSTRLKSSVICWTMRLTAVTRAKLESQGLNTFRRMLTLAKHAWCQSKGNKLSLLRCFFLGQVSSPVGDHCEEKSQVIPLALCELFSYWLLDTNKCNFQRLTAETWLTSLHRPVE